MRGDDELDIREMLPEPGPHSSLPGGVKVGVDLVDENDSRHQYLRRVFGSEQPFSSILSGKLSNQLERHAQNGTITIAQFLDGHFATAPIHEGDLARGYFQQFGSEREEIWLIDKLFDGIEQMTRTVP